MSSFHQTNSRYLPMSATAFDPARLDHWLLLLCVSAVAVWGLWQCWQWQQYRDRR
ncbi:MAG: hypothetical protein F6K00_27845 [Leptolyngbya sp. SIOISBB]|nr:hypothetical protein [Leptolyngbya sp. SIOISBB]